ncbi:MAG: hypothetical protein WD773_03680 [Gemmatimonadales bacterium]
MINTSAGDAGPHLSRDGHYLFFTSQRPGGHGSNDLNVSYRAHTHDDFAWEAPVNLGPPVNTSEAELGPHLLRPEFYFWRGPASTLANPGDIYVSKMIGDVFGPALPVAELNSAGHDEKPSLRFDGREIFLASDRARTLDIWVSTRQARSDAWSAPVSLGPAINTEFQDRRPALSSDGTMLFFDSNRPGGSGNLDLYVAVRIRGSNE